MNILKSYNEFKNSHFELNVDHYGTEACQSNYSFGPSVRDNYVLHFISKGSGKFYIDQQMHHLRAGDLFILPPDKVTFYQADEEDPWTYSWVGFSGAQAGHLFQKTSLQGQYIAHSTLDSKIYQQMIQINNYGSQPLDAINDLLLTSELYKLLALLIEECPSQMQDHLDASVAKTYVEQTVKMIHGQYHRKLQVSEIAQKLNINRSYLYQIFKAHTGQSIQEYLIRVRMNRSDELLQNLSLSIQDVAISVGYSDQLAFSHSFKNFYGLSPKHYRQKYYEKA
ncbi:AraC family transcriptional regulator [Streptococcus merionis]|uniref:AraC family transcriptional regulator n=1 Tax=Streptococcus merionis TaxID=400065 RepID=A0A239SXL5_9STRE|nr:AraC family transcriptional regulator [Streptococcus merionis]SNU90241.1 AraC family transcriptional regulator [Streptococcus merionis]